MTLHSPSILQEDLSNFRSSDVVTRQKPTEKCSSMNLFDGSIIGNDEDIQVFQFMGIGPQIVWRGSVEQ